jgi:hypothetical protein
MARDQIQSPSAASKTAQFAPWVKPAGTCVCVLLFLGGLNLLSIGLTSALVEKTPVDFHTHDLNYFWSMYFSPINLKAHRDFITGVVLLGASTGILGLAWGLLDPVPSAAPVKPAVFYGVAGVLMVCIAAFILHFGMGQFSGNDHSCLVDPAWRLINGQTPYMDFPCTQPVGFLLGAKFALQWFGVYWRSFIIMNALFAMATFAWSLFLMAELFGRGWPALIWAMGLQAFSTMLASFWWYNMILAVSAVLYLLSATYWLRRPGRNSAVVSYAAALLLLATMKPNVAGVLIPGISVILFMSPKHRWKVLWVSIGVFVIFLILLTLNHFSFPQMIEGYLSIAQRGASVVQFLQGLNPFELRMALLILASALFPALLALGQGRRTLRSPVSWLPAVIMVLGFYIFVTHFEHKRLGQAACFLPVMLGLCLCQRLRSLGLWIPVIALFGGLYGYMTNGENKLVDLSVVFFAAILIVAELRTSEFPDEGTVFPMPVWWNRYLALACVVLSAVGLAQGISRDRVESAGPVQFFEWDGSKYTIADGFFKGLRCGEVFNEVVKEVGDVLHREPSASAWFGPRMQFGYADFNLQSPMHEPINWDHGQTLYAASKEDYYFNNFLQSRRQLVFLFKNDPGMLTQDEVQRMLQQYNVDQSYPLLTVLRLKK